MHTFLQARGPSLPNQESWFGFPFILPSLVGVRSISSGVWRTPLSTTHGPGPRPPGTGSVLPLEFTSPGCAISSPVPPLSEALGVVGSQFPLHNMGLMSGLLGDSEGVGKNWRT